MADYDAKAHYRSLSDSNWLNWTYLNNQPALVKITEVKGRVPLMKPGGKEVKKAILYYKQVRGAMEEEKPLVLCQTNLDSLAEMFGEEFPNWIDKEVVLYQGVTKFGPKTVPCVRIREPKKRSTAT